MFNFFSRNKNKPILFQDFSEVAVDMHSHLIPGIDDGAQEVAQSLEMIERLVEMGYTKLIITPHIMSDYYKNTPEIIKQGLQKLQGAVNEMGYAVELEAAAEYYFDYVFKEKIGKEPLLCFGKNNYLLMEMSFYNQPEGLNEAFFDLQVNGYTPILAHVERYSYLAENIENYEQLKDRGVILQMNINSLEGAYSSEVKKIAEKLIDHNLIDIIGTDLHNINQISSLLETRKNKHLHKLISSGKLLNKSLL